MINALQQSVQGTRLADNSASKKPATAAAAPFDSVLNSLRKVKALPEKAQQAAADLMRIEMMRHSLSLSGEGETATTSGVRALESLVAGMAGGRANATAPVKAPVVAAADARATAPVVAGADSDRGILGNLKSMLSHGVAKAEEIGNTAADFLGIPYRFGGESANGIDCSSFVQQVFREHQIALPRTAREQMKVGTDVGAGELKKGDLVFFHTYASYPSHVGIYLGDGKMIHASSAKGEVTVSDINSDYYRSRFMGAKRVG